MKSKKSKQTKEQIIEKLKRSIRKFGDPHGDKAQKIKDLQR
jgi:hypothetical protein